VGFWIGNHEKDQVINRNLKFTAFPTPPTTLDPSSLERREAGAHKGGMKIG
jgi:hypothetical protein